MIQFGDKSDNFGAGTLNMILFLYIINSIAAPFPSGNFHQPEYTLSINSTHTHTQLHSTHPHPVKHTLSHLQPRSR